MAELSFQLSFAGTPFLTDVARVIRMAQPSPEQEVSSQLPAEKHQSLPDLIDEIDRLLPAQYLQDFSPQSLYPGCNLSAVAFQGQTDPQPGTTVRIGDWYYPTGAVRWSVFRGLMTSAMVKAVLAATGGGTGEFVMKQNPVIPKGDESDGPWTLRTNMFCLPPRPIGEPNDYEGLYLVTLVDSRFYFQGTPTTLRVNHHSTWASVLTTLAADLGITLTYSAIPAVYGQPEPDSQLWSTNENAAVLLDAVAYNVGRIVVRNLNGMFTLLTPFESQAVAEANRGAVREVVRLAGGEMFGSGSLLPVGDLRPGRNAVVPASIVVGFPKYVVGDAPVPHSVNSRYANQRPSTWFEDGFGDEYSISVPVASGGALVSGLIGTSTQLVHDTAKALVSGEIAGSGMALNHSGLMALASQIAQDRYNAQVAASLDESYPGTFVWAPEGIHDVIWTFSERSRMACTRVMRTAWNAGVTEFQHSSTPLSGFTNVPKGVGGPSVAQTVRDSVSGTISTVLTGTLNSGVMQAFLATTAYLPTQNRWRGTVFTSGAAGSGVPANAETILFEGTSGDPSFVQIVQRGIDGTIEQDHANGDPLVQVLPNVNYGTNLVTYEKAEFVYPAEWTSGGIAGLAKVPQNQSVVCLGDAAATLNSGVQHWSGQVQLYDVQGTSGSQFPDRELVWLVERNGGSLTQGRRYQGQLAGYSASGPVAPVYLVSEGGGGTSTSSATLRVRVATTEAITLSGFQVIDGVQLVAGDRVLVKDQTAAITNGVYVADGGAWNRSSDFTGTVFSMTLIVVEEGSLWGTTEWRLVNHDPITVGLTQLDFRKLAPLGTRTPGGYMQTSQRVRLTASEVGIQGTVVDASNTTPIVIQSVNALMGGETVTVSGVKGNTAANGTWTITLIDGTHFSLNGSVGNGAYTSGGEWGNWSFAGNVVTSPSLSLVAMDGATLANGDLVLLRFPDSPYAGVYAVTDTLAGTLTRDVNYNVSVDFYCGLQIFVVEGTTYNQTVWRLMTPDFVTLNTSPQQWMEWPEFFEGRQSNVRLTARHDMTITPIVHRFDDGYDTVEWVFDAQVSGGPNSGIMLLTCEDVTGSPSYSGIDTLQAVKAEGMVWTNPGAGIAKFRQLQQMSVTSDALGLKFVNDQDAPGPLFAYMTDSGGTKGWNQLTGASGIINIFNITNIFITNIYISGTIIIIGSGGPISGVLQIIQDEGVDLEFKPKINFVGPRVNAIETATLANDVIVDVNYSTRNANFFPVTSAETLYGIDAGTFGGLVATLGAGAIAGSHPIIHFYLKTGNTNPQEVFTLTGLIGPDRYLSDEGQYISAFWNGANWLPIAQGPLKMYDNNTSLAYEPRLSFFDGVKAKDDADYFSTDVSLNISGLASGQPGSGAVFAYYESATGPLHHKTPLNYLKPFSGLAGAWQTQNVLVSGTCVSGGGLKLQTLIMTYPSGLIYFV